MFSHVTVGTNDGAKAKAFYGKVLGALGITLAHDLEEYGWYGFGRPGDAQAGFWVGKPANGGPATFANGGTIAFNAAKRSEVDAFHKAAMEQGGTDEGGPGLRPHYHPNYYGAYVRDPDGNKLCCVCHRPE
ncbi:MAG TPA: VOC family protein [Beijerinckiaceae bacterium]|nr:VOC family protein [Beijerinckiaceae bacterium]